MYELERMQVSWNSVDMLGDNTKMEIEEIDYVRVVWNGMNLIKIESYRNVSQSYYVLNGDESRYYSVYWKRLFSTECPLFDTACLCTVMQHSRHTAVPKIN